MARYTDTQAMSFDVFPQERSLIVDANAGEVTINAWDGAGFVVSDVINSDSANVIFTSGMRLQFVPTGGATYYIDESNRAS